jgi:hypothetical protein
MIPQVVHNSQFHSIYANALVAALIMLAILLVLKTEKPLGDMHREF